MSFDLTGKTVFITGATSGLGRHFARVLAKAGCDVAIAGRRPDLLSSLKAEIEAMGRRCASIPLDVADAAAIPGAVEAAETALGPINILINNAGIGGEGMATAIDAAGFDAVMNTNVRAPYLLAGEFARRMIARGQGGRIINIASIAAFRVLPGLSAYCTSKAALAMMTQSLAREWVRHGINVNAICPGFIETGINAAWFATEGGQKQIKSFPRRKLALESDLDGTLLLLASDASAAITGALLTVDDGQSLS